jgi:cyclic pyranopterin phosphate synthase
MFDSYNRQITYLRISVTDRCNLRCIYCMPPEGIRLKRRRDILSYEEITDVVKCAVELGIIRVRLTGGEPLVRKGVEKFVAILKNIEGLHEVTMTTNGTLLKQKAALLKEAGLDRLNISLDTIRPQLYRYITCGGDVYAVLSGITAAQKAGFHRIKINMVMIAGLNDMLEEEMRRFCYTNDLELQRINHYSLHEHLCRNQTDYERPLPCSSCNRIRLTADGKLKPCLFSDIEIPVKMNAIRESILEAVRIKPPEGQVCTTRGNWEIGG